MADVTVLGLGQMGFRLAELLVAAGRSVTVWNRDPAKADRLVDRGAILANDAVAAIGASPALVICLSDYAAVRSVLLPEDSKADLADRVIINLGTGGPDEALAIGSELALRGARYLDGAIQAAPAQMGRPDTPVLISGDRATFDVVENMLNVIAGNLVYLGDRVDAAAYMDLATLSYVYGATAGFLHGSLVAEKVGIDVGTFGAIVNDIAPTFGEFFKHEGSVIASGDFTISESPMRISIAAVDRLVRTSHDLDINAELPMMFNHWLKQAERDGFADEEVAALVKVLRKHG